MLKLIVLKNFVHFMDRTVIALNNSQKGHTEGQSINTDPGNTPTDNNSLDRERRQTEGPSTSTGAHKIPTDSKSLDRERGQTEEPSTSTSAHKTPADNKSQDSEEGQTEGPSTSTSAHKTPTDSKSLDRERGKTEEPSTSTSAHKTPADSKSLDRERGKTEEPSTSTSAHKTPADSKSQDSEEGQTEGPSTSTGALKTPTDSKSPDRERGQTEGPSTSTGAHKTPADSNVLDSAQKKQKVGQSTNTGANSTPRDSKTIDSTEGKQTEEQSAKCNQKTTTLYGNALNIFVGANFCGKSTVLELIRRSMTDEINVSVTRPYDETMVSYAFCQFYLPEHGEIISGIIRDPNMKKMFKVFIYKNRTLVRSKLSESKITRSFSFEEQEGEEVFKSIFNKTGDEISDDRVNHILEMIKQSKEESFSNEPNWKSLEDKFIATFPLRGIGSVQWTRSKRIGKKHKASNYKMASKRAEIISTLLSPEKYKKLINKNDETRIFNFLTYPEVFKFEIVKGKVKVEHNSSQFELLKTSEGIIEAKVVSLLIAHKGITTLCLEDPDRGMHPQMIERLKTVLYDSAHHKTIIVVTHSPYFIDSLTIHRTHVFIRNRLYEPYVCSVLNVRENSDLSRVADIETIRILLFATKVLLVEGVIDREVVQLILTQDKCIELEKSRSSENNEEVNKDYFTKTISTHQIIPIDGCDNVDKVQTFCEYINLPCLCLLDRDKVKNHFKEKGKFWGKRKDKNHIENLEKDLSIIRLEKFDDYIEALKSRRKKTTNQKTHRAISEIISFRLKEKRDEDLEKYIVSLESKLGLENSLELRYNSFETYSQCFQSKKNCQKQQNQEKEILKTIAMFWLERKEEEEFDSYIDNLNKEYSGKTGKKPFEFWKKNSKGCEGYLSKLESYRKTFVWRNGALEDAIRSSDNYDKIIGLLTSTDQETIEDMPSSSIKCIDKSKQTKAERSKKSNVAEKLLEQLDENTIEKRCYFGGSTVQNESKNTAASGVESSEKGIDKKTKTKDEMSRKRLGENMNEQFFNYVDSTAQNESEITAFGDENSEKVEKNTKTTDKMSQRSNVDLKQKLREVMDEYTRQQFCNYLMEIQEIKNFISFMAKENTKPEESQLKECSTSDDADCCQAGSCVTCFRRCRSCCD